LLNLRQNVESARHARAVADIRAISSQLNVYETTNGFNPTTEQGLRALVVQPVTDPKPAAWHQLYEAVPKDPWGTEYIYVCPGRKHPDSFDLYSSGPGKRQDTPDGVWGD
jgi:general secretion pathway protein G